MFTECNLGMWQERGPDDPDLEWKKSGTVAPRVQANKTGQRMPIKVDDHTSPKQVTREDFTTCRMQILKFRRFGM